MATALPVESYAFILRKHKWLVLGTVVVVLAVGWLYARSQPEIFRSFAKVKLLKVSGGGNRSEDATFVADEIHRLRTDPQLAEQALEWLRRPDNAGGRPDEAGLFAGISPRALRGMVSVRRIEGTSYFEVAVEGRDPRVNVAVANAYAHVFERTFREQKQRQLDEGVEAHRARLDDARKRLDDLIEEKRRLRELHPDVDFTRTSPGSALDELNALNATLALERRQVHALGREIDTMNAVLGDAGLRVVRAADGRFRFERADGSAPDHEALAAILLSTRIQKMDRVAGDATVRGLHAELQRYRDDDTRLHLDRGFAEGSAERTAIRTKVETARRALAEATEAVILVAFETHDRLSQGFAGAEEQQRNLRERIEATSAAQARYEELDVRIRQAEAAVASADTVHREAMSQRDRVLGTGDEAGVVRVVEAARLEGSVRVRPNRPLMYMITVVVAIVLAAGMAYVLEFLDDTVKSREDFDRLVRLRFLGFVPHIREKDAARGAGATAPAAGDGSGARGVRAPDLIVVRGRTGSPEVESFRAIRTGVQFCRADREVHTFLVTSAGPGEGKTTVSLNLAATFAGPGRRVLLVDADLRRARIHHAVGLPNDVGLSQVLGGTVALADAVHEVVIDEQVAGEDGVEAPVRRLEGLWVLPSGPVPPNPADVLGSKKMAEFLAAAREQFDCVIVDSPPIVAVTDPVLLARYVDAVFLVVSLGKTSVRLIQRARETLATVGADIHGAILNNSDARHSGYYGYGYRGYGYSYGYGYGQGYGYGHGYGEGYPSREAPPKGEGRSREAAGDKRG